MATYYRWEKLSPTFYGSQTELTNGVIADTTTDPNAILWIWNVDISDVINTGKAIVETKYGQIPSGQSLSGLNGTYAIFYGEKKETVTTYYHLLNDSSVGRYNTISNNSGEAKVVGKGSYSAYNYRKSYGYVYSTNPDAYPNDGVSGDYYYSGRTTITSPTAPTRITYPSVITTESITVSWPTATSNITSYPVNGYELSYSTNGGSSWTSMGVSSNTSRTFSIPSGAVNVMFRVRARDTNGQWSDYITGPKATVLQPPTITAPAAAMSGNTIDITWSDVTSVDSYTLQRKVDSGEWEQIYSGAETSYTDTVGDWDTVQYKVQAVIDGTGSDWSQPAAVDILPVSTLSIGGQDGDLGTIIDDVQYSMATDTGKNISLSVTVNSIQVDSREVGTLYTGRIPVMDLPTGTGTIIITATVTADSGPVTVTRTWTYTKAAQTFPDRGGVMQLRKAGKTVFPKTLADLVRTPAFLGGNLSATLEKLARAAVYSHTKTPKYTEIKVDLSQITAQDAKDGKIIMLPYQGKMVPHIVVQVGNPDPEMYDSSCEGVWLLRQDIAESGQWNSTNVNTLEGSTIMTTMQGYVTDYDSTVQSAMLTVKIPYCVGGGDATVKTLADGLECKMFPLCGYEVGFDASNSQYFPVDGSVLSYFQDTSAIDSKRISRFNGNASSWHLRDPVTNRNENAWGVTSTGGFSNYNSIDSRGYRPCFLLPTTFQATYYVGTDGNVHDEQEYTTACDFYDLWGNVIPSVKIATGSYVGTGTYGVDNPNEFVAGFPVKFAYIVTNTGTLFMTPQEGDFLANTTSYIKSGGYTSSGLSKQTDNGVNWYGSNAEYQMNYSGQKYYIFAIG